MGARWRSVTLGVSCQIKDGGGSEAQSLTRLPWAANVSFEAIIQFDHPVRLDYYEL